MMMMQQDVAVGLTASELERYRTQGFIGPFPLLTDKAIEGVLGEFARTRDQLPWYKCQHAYRGPIVDALRSEQVVGRVASILGNDLMLWGSQVMVKSAGRAHRWHVDVETMEWTSINFWAALRNVSKDATILLLPGTQRLRVSPQALERTEKLDVNDSAAVQRAAAALGVDSEIVTVDVPAGHFVLFDGHLWHGSVNNSQKERSALLVQYSPTTEWARIPKTYTPPIQWEEKPAPCVLVRGRDLSGGKNHYITPGEPPQGNPTLLRVRKAIKNRLTPSREKASAKVDLSVCLVGAGSAAQRHVQALRAVLGSGARISVVGRDPERVAAWAEARGIERAYRSADEAMASRDDIVVIATPPTTHASYVDLAMAAGKHVLVEKPAFRSLDELVARLPAVRDYKRAWMVAENSHFSPVHRLVLQHVVAGAIGTPVMTTIRRLRRRLPAEGWKAQLAESDGALNEGGIHWIRVGLALTGVAGAADVEWVFAAEPGIKTIANHGDDTAAVMWRTRSGALGELGHSWGLEGGKLPLRSAVVGTQGAIYFDPAGRFATLSKGHRMAQRPLVPWRELRARDDLSGTTEMWRSFLESVRSGSPVAHTIEEAAADLGVVDAAYKSMKSGATERLDTRLVKP
jgi:predicted dehydrogenase